MKEALFISILQIRKLRLRGCHLPKWLESDATKISVQVLSDFCPSEIDGRKNEEAKSRFYGLPQGGVGSYGQGAQGEVSSLGGRRGLWRCQFGYRSTRSLGLRQGRLSSVWTHRLCGTHASPCWSQLGMSGNTGLELQELRNVHEANHWRPERRGGDPHPAPGTERRKGKFQSLKDTSS